MTFQTHLFNVLVTFFGNASEFTLQDVYKVAGGGLSYLYPDNNSINPSIRANLQRLRDSDIIAFVDNDGTYTWV
jgi:hypothetical protein